MKTKKLVLPIMLLITMLLVPLVKAQFGGFSEYIISDILRSEFFHFVLLFLFFFGISYFALKKIIFGEEPAIASIVAIVISFFVTTGFFAYLEEFLTSKIVFYVALFGALLAIMVLIKLLMKIGFLNLAWLSGIYLVFFIVLKYTKLIPFKYRSTLTSGNVGHLLGVIAIFAAIIILFNLFNRWRKRKGAVEKEAKVERKIEEEKERGRRTVDKEMGGKK